MIVNNRCVAVKFCAGCGKGGSIGLSAYGHEHIVCAESTAVGSYRKLLTVLYLFKLCRCMYCDPLFYELLF